MINTLHGTMKVPERVFNVVCGHFVADVVTKVMINRFECIVVLHPKLVNVFVRVNG